MPAIHQLTAGFSSGDAITNEALVMRDVFRSWGHDSEIFTDPTNNHSELRQHARDMAELAGTVCRQDIAFLHFSIGSPVNALFANLPCRKVLLYHNITPSHYFDLVNPEIARDLARGRTQIETLSGVADINMADSRFNAGELYDLGYTDIKILPLVLNFDILTGKSDPATLREFDDGTVNILFVGRCAPNKRLEDIIDAFAVFHSAAQPDSRLIIVGSATGTERYRGTLLGMVHDMQIENAVHFAGPVPQAKLNAFYRCADIFLCMSEHEGFCIPVIESMVHDLPVMAYSAAAVPETMDGSGILFSEKNFDAIAEMMQKLTSDGEFRAAVLFGQQERLKKLRNRDLAGELKQHLSLLL